MFFSTRVRGPRPQAVNHSTTRRFVLFSLFACVMILTSLTFPAPVTQAATDVRPTVEKFTIGSQDVLASPDVTLHISATAHNGGSLTKMFIREWALSHDSGPDGKGPNWVELNSTGWIPFQTALPYTLGSQAGVHYMAVWVADNAGNASEYTKAAADYADLVQTGASLPQNGLVPYLVSYTAGTQVSVNITASQGNPYLFVWYAGNTHSPNKYNLSVGNTTFTAPYSGTYLFVVFAPEAVKYTLAITPAGGPNILEDVVQVTETPPSSGGVYSSSPVTQMAPTVQNVPAPGVQSVIPTVEKFTIGSQDVLASPSVTLHIQATAHNGGSLTKMFIREWALSHDTQPNWVVLKSSGWIPYQADFAYTLGSQPGVHYMAVWVADNQGNASEYTKTSVDYADLVQPNTPLVQYGLVPYLVSYTASTNVTVNVTATKGEPYLFVWYAGNTAQPNKYNLSVGSTTFTAPYSGTYLFVVFAPQDVTYTMTLAPAGGPNIIEDVIQGTATPTPQPGGGSYYSSSPISQKAPTVQNVPGPKTVSDLLPTVEKFTIDSQDVLASRDVVLHIQALPNVNSSSPLAQMYIREWALTHVDQPNWVVVKNTGWIPYSADLNYQLGSEPGVHYMAVVVADAAGKVSAYTKKAADYADLVQAGVSLPKNGLVPYLVSYPAGTQVSVSLTATQGNPYLFVWYAGNKNAPNKYNLSVGNAAFTAPNDGSYLFIVFAPEAAKYTLTITPAGGPNILEDIIVNPNGPDPAASGTYTSNPVQYYDPITAGGSMPTTTLPLDKFIYLPITAR